jgi:hypothetical protein
VNFISLRSQGDLRRAVEELVGAIVELPEAQQDQQ